jgi:hypothetical protein
LKFIPRSQMISHTLTVAMRLCQFDFVSKFWSRTHRKPYKKLLTLCLLRELISKKYRNYHREFGKEVTSEKSFFKNFSLINLLSFFRKFSFFINFSSISTSTRS